MSSSRARIGLSLALLAPAALSQGDTIFHTNPSTTGTYGKSAFVDLDGDTYPDLVSLRDGEIDVRFALALCEVIKTGVATGVNDITTLPASSGNPGAVVLATDTQVLKLEWDGDAFGTTVMSNQGATLIARERKIGSGARTLVLVRPNKRSVRRLTEGGLGTWSGQLLAVEAQDILELESVDTDGDGTPEICEMVADGAAFRENDGTFIAYHIASAAQATTTTEATTVVSTAGSKQVVALAVRFSNPPADDVQIISTVDESGFLYNTQFAGDTGVSGLAAKDTELIPDGQADLSLSWQYGPEVVQLEAEASSTSPIFDIYAPDVFHYISYAPATVTGNVAQPALADVDGDGDIDTVLRLQSTQQDFVYLNPSVDEETMKPLLDEVITSCAYDYVTGELLDAVQLSLTGSLLGAADLGNDDTLEIVVYQKLSPSDNDPILVDPVSVVRVPITSNTLPFSAFVPLGEAPNAQGDATFESLYFLVLRRAEVDGAGHAAHRGPNRIYVVSNQSSSSANSVWIGELPSYDPNDIPVRVLPCQEVPPPPSPPGGNVLYKDNDDVPGGLGSNGDDPPCLPPPTGGNNPPKGGD